MFQKEVNTMALNKNLTYGIIAAIIIAVFIIGIVVTSSAGSKVTTATTPLPPPTPTEIKAVGTTPVAAGTIVSQATPPVSQVSGTITLSGAFALYPLAVVWADEYKKTHPNVKIEVSAGGAGKGMSDTLGGLVDIGMVSRAISDTEIQKGAYPIPVTKDAVVPVINAKNPVVKEIQAKGISQSTWKKIYIDRTVLNWGEVGGRPEITDKIHLFTRSDSSGAADIWALYVGGKAQANLRGIGVFGDPGLLSEVQKDQLGVGFNNINYAYDAKTGLPVAGVVIPPFILNDNTVLDISTKEKAVAAIKSQTFPHPPARVEYFVTKGKPTGVTADFIKWTLTDGQKFVDANGYIELPSDAIASSLQKVA
ncbi:MAG: substrate-binding domain-containing protein [Methanoregula sp.]